ncbi:unnamed protein product [Heligmosomoides polygyrus]|uniref:Uncharacterized protein n=1 Tax=Heligmosomoides polygyrus TaxID=6339 RepID=A0A183G1R7_HELPZ|nr:unnamed protein product [Heligmosomoides polygyrus]
MSQSTAHTRTLMPVVAARRGLATETSPEDYDPLGHATGREKKMLLARLTGDDRYEPKVYYRAESSTKERPNLVPSHFPERISEPDSGDVNFMIVRKGMPKRCECRHWFKAIDADPESV